jgi:predicted nuclease of predicted toxin-antitoxin system
MRFLLDNNLSPTLADHLRAASHEVVHVRDIDMRSAAEPDGRVSPIPGDARYRGS